MLAVQDWSVHRATGQCSGNCCKGPVAIHRLHAPRYSSCNGQPELCTNMASILKAVSMSAEAGQQRVSCTDEP